ncbi:ribosomal protein L35 [Kwoniella heveanensis BCC8398]|uniref:Ribosomal protein L35 n=1 Tax=Kwoniella heveanensis BCC8398 TaxID=1296120 RepID=A0A1B9GV14_9TREE|nr:ribosomal protein L35 [Kwoniella heveanensis BCC8398]
MSFLTRISLRPASTSFFAVSSAGPSRLPAAITMSSRGIQPPVNVAQSHVSMFSTSSTMMVKQKLKSHSGCKKRFFPNASGMFKRAQTGKAHLNTAFSTARINRLAKQVYTTKTQSKLLRKLLPYA